MKIAFVAVFAALIACGSSNAASPTCIPSEFGGSGSQYLTSVSGRGWWVGWWCPGEKSPTVYACRYASCPSPSNIGAAFAKLSTWPSVDTLKGMTAGIGDKASVSDVWSPDISKLDAVRPK